MKMGEQATRGVYSVECDYGKVSCFFHFHLVSGKRSQRGEQRVARQKERKNEKKTIPENGKWIFIESEANAELKIKENWNFRCSHSIDTVNRRLIPINQQIDSWIYFIYVPLWTLVSLIFGSRYPNHFFRVCSHYKNSHKTYEKTVTLSMNVNYECDEYSRWLWPLPLSVDHSNLICLTFN